MEMHTVGGMTFGDILHHPGSYVLLIVTICGSYYAKGSFLKAVTLGTLTPMILVPVWFAMLIASSCITIPFKEFFPNLFGAISSNFDALPILAQQLLLPANFLTLALYLYYCHYERKNRGLPVGYVYSGTRTDSANAYSRRLRK